MHLKLSSGEFSIKNFAFWTMIISIFSVMTNNIPFIIISVPLSMFLEIFLLKKQNIKLYFPKCFIPVVALLLLTGISLVLNRNLNNSKLFYMRLTYSTVLSMLIFDLIKENFKYYINRLFYVITIIHVIGIMFFRSTCFYSYQGEMVFGMPGFAKNGTAMLLAFSMLVFVSDLKETFYQQKKINFMALIMFIINVVLITKTKSGSGLVMVGLSVVILFINEKSLLKIFKIMPIIIIAILVIYIISYEFLLHSQLDEMFHKYLGKSIALSGRIDIWRFSLEMFIKKPILGYGYWGLWSDPTYVLQMLRETGYAISGFKAHCGYLAILLDCGIIGALIIAYICTSHIKAVKRVNKYIDYHIFEISWVLCILIYNLSEDALFTYTFPWCFIIFLIGHAYYLKNIKKNIK